MPDGFDYPGSHFDNWDASSKRRHGASLGAPKEASWDVPEDWQAPNQYASSAPQPVAAGSYQPTGYEGGNSVAGSYGSTGDPYLDSLRAAGMADAVGAQYGARTAAMNASPNDPSLAAFADLSTTIGGQSNAAHNLNAAGMQYAGQEHAQQLQMEMAKYQQQLEMEAWKEQNKNAWMGDLAGFAGKAAGAWLAPGGFFAGAK